MSVQGTLSAAERSIRSVFVGNIPYEATEEQLKDIFSEVGPVVSFRLVYDRETGKPKGYGFCEYKDQETALSAMRNLNGYELNGRALRVDNAASEKNKEELKNLQAALGGPPQESPYGIDCEPDKAPEAITKAVASLPPEQMFELMKQMKLCIQNNPNEARTMLLQNPQLAYALLQAQVVMRIVDPQVAMSMLHRANTNVQPLTAAPGNEEFTAPVNNNMDTQSALSFQRFESFLNNPMQVNNNQVAPPSAPAKPTNNFVDTFGLLNAGPRPGAPAPTPAPAPAPVMPGPTQNIRPGRPALLGDRPPIPDRGPSLQPPVVNQLPPRDFDMRDPRTIDPRSMGDRDMRLLPNAGPPPREIRDPRDPRDPRETRDLRDPRDPRDMRDPRLITSDTDSRSGFDQRYRGPDPRYDGRQGPFEARGPPGFDQRPVGAAFDQRPTNAAFDQRSSGAAFDQRPSGGGGGFDQRPSGPPFDQRPNLGAGFDQRAAGGGFDQRPAGAPFEQRSGGAGFEPRPATAAFEQRPAAAPFERPAAAFDQRSPVYDQRDPRAAQPPPHSSPGGPPVRPAQVPAMSRPTMPAASVPGAISGASPRPGTPSQVQVSAQDQEKAALIMQVLQLSDQQIAMLPPEQRQSIMVLKDQIARSTQPQ